MQFRQWIGVISLAALGAVSAAPAEAANSIHGTSEVEVTADPGFVGLYKYTLHLTWDLYDGAEGRAHFYVRLGSLTETCEGSSVVFSDPAGSSPGDDDGSPCEAVYEGEYFCQDLPWFPILDQISFAKFDQANAECEASNEASGEFIFYSSIPPGVPGEHRYSVAMRKGFNLAVGHIEGPLPGLSAFRESGVVLINEFLVKPKPGDSEFIEVFSTQNEPVDLSGWYLEINEETRIPLGGEITGGGHEVTSGAQPPNTVLVDFDVDPFGAPIAGGADVSHAYDALGITFTGLPALDGSETCSGGSGVFANPYWSHSEDFGSPPNVASVCPGEGGAAFGENLDGTIQVDFCAAVGRVCIDVMPEGALDYGFIRVEALGDSVQGEIVTAPGVPGTICFEFPSLSRMTFGGFGSGRTAFDNLLVTFLSDTGCEVIGRVVARPEAAEATAEEDEGFLPDDGGVIVLFDNFHTVQDSVAYGNKGGAPISAPIVFPPGYPVPPIFQKGTTFGTAAAAQDEPDTLSTSTQRTGDDTGSSAEDFSVGAPTPETSSEGSVEAPALGSSVRVNGVYAFGLGTDGLEFFNPTSNLVDMAGWFISDGSVIEPIYDVGGPEPVPSGDRTVLPQGFPATFSFELDYEDVLYLYDQNLVRLDQIGWTQTPFSFPDLCLVRLPDGAGPADGYDFNTSGGSSGNLLYLDCALRSPTVGSEAGRFTTSLAAPYPNPAAGLGTVSFVVGGNGSEASPVHLALYDVAGRRLATLVDDALAPGPYAIRWDGRREDGTEAGTGIYFVRLRVGQAEPLTRSIVWGAP